MCTKQCTFTVTCEESTTGSIIVPFGQELVFKNSQNQDNTIKEPGDYIMSLENNELVTQVYQPLPPTT